MYVRKKFFHQRKKIIYQTKTPIPPPPTPPPSTLKSQMIGSLLTIHIIWLKIFSQQRASYWLLQGHMTCTTMKLLPAKISYSKQY